MVNRKKGIYSTYLEGKYTVLFGDFKYPKEAVKIHSLINSEVIPDVDGGFWGFDTMRGYFSKNGITVSLLYDSLIEYEWQVESSEKSLLETEATVWEWANIVFNKFMELGNE